MRYEPSPTAVPQPKWRPESQGYDDLTQIRLREPSPSFVGNLQPYTLQGIFDIFFCPLRLSNVVEKKCSGNGDSGESYCSSLRDARLRGLD